jgi:hypothetical protein
VIFVAPAGLSVTCCGTRTKTAPIILFALMIAGVDFGWRAHMEKNRFLEEEVNKYTGEARVLFSFGKYKGEYLDDVITEFIGRKYVEWMLEEIEDLPSEVMEVLEQHLESVGRSRR